MDSDPLLFVTSEFEVTIEVYEDLHDAIFNLMATHQPTKCDGLRFHKMCGICGSQYNNPAYGSTLKYKLEALSAIYGEEVIPDEGFDPDAYNDSQDAFLQVHARHTRGQPFLP